MPCDQCPHCRARAERAELRLSSTTPRSVPGGVDRAFYLDFGKTYDLARSRTTQPVKLLVEVNPGLTRARCGAYLKRARALGFVTTPGRGTPAAAPVAEAPAEPEVWDGPAPEALAEQHARYRAFSDEAWSALDGDEQRAWLARPEPGRTEAWERHLGRLAVLAED